MPSMWTEDPDYSQPKAVNSEKLYINWNAITTPLDNPHIDLLTPINCLTYWTSLLPEKNQQTLLRSKKTFVLGSNYSAVILTLNEIIAKKETLPTFVNKTINLESFRMELQENSNLTIQSINYTNRRRTWQIHYLNQTAACNTKQIIHFTKGSIRLTFD